jgi:hypothetical protein
MSFSKVNYWSQHLRFSVGDRHSPMQQEERVRPPREVSCASRHRSRGTDRPMCQTCQSSKAREILDGVLFQETKSSAECLGSSTPLSPVGRLHVSRASRVRASAREQHLTARSAPRLSRG